MKDVRPILGSVVLREINVKGTLSICIVWSENWTQNSQAHVNMDLEWYIEKRYFCLFLLSSQCTGRFHNIISGCSAPRVIFLCSSLPNMPLMANYISPTIQKRQQYCYYMLLHAVALWNFVSTKHHRAACLFSSLIPFIQSTSLFMTLHNSSYCL